MFIKESRSDGDDVGANILEHGPVVDVPAFDTESLPGVGKPVRIGIGDGDEIAAGDVPPHGVEAMAIVTAAGMPNHRDAPAF